MSAEPDATGRHSVVLSLSGDDAHTSAVDYITKTAKGWTDFPLVSVIYEDDDFSVTTYGTAPQVVDATVQDPWTGNAAAHYAGDATTQTICESAPAGVATAWRGPCREGLRHPWSHRQTACHGATGVGAYLPY